MAQSLFEPWVDWHNLVMSKKKRWKKDTGELLTFSELVSDLQSIADELIECAPVVNAVTVIGIDFRNPKR